jgi:hypothetical protein
MIKMRRCQLDDKNEHILHILSSFYHPGDYYQTFVDEFIVLAKSFHSEICSLGRGGKGEGGALGNLFLRYQQIGYGPRDEHVYGTCP